MKQVTKILLQITAIYIAVAVCAIVIAMLWIKRPNPEWINPCYSDNAIRDGVLWFKRDGQTRKLFTEAFEAYWKTLAPVAPQQSEGSVSGKPVAAALPELKEMK